MPKYSEFDTYLMIQFAFFSYLLSSGNCCYTLIFTNIYLTYSITKDKTI